MVQHLFLVIHYVCRSWNPANSPVEVGSWNPILYRVLYVHPRWLAFGFLNRINGAHFLDLPPPAKMNECVDPEKGKEPIPQKGEVCIWTDHGTLAGISEEWNWGMHLGEKMENHLEKRRELRRDFFSINLKSPQTRHGLQVVEAEFLRNRNPTLDGNKTPICIVQMFHGCFFNQQVERHPISNFPWKMVVSFGWR